MVRTGMVALGLLGALLAPHTAEAGLEICNATEVRQSVAIGYKSGDVWMSEGWWVIAPGDCAEPVSGNLRNRYYYLHLEASGRQFVAEDYSFCIASDAFTIEGDTDCAARGYETARFIELDTGATATHFTKSITTDLSRVTGGETQQSPGSSDAASTGADPDAAAGLEICNETGAEQSIAVGYKSGDIWVSEGWWVAQPGDCVTPVQTALQNRYYYMYAEADERAFQSENYGFCITSEAFTIEGDTDCTERGYERAMFVEIDTGETARFHRAALTDALSRDKGKSGKGGRASESGGATVPDATVEAPAGDAPGGEIVGADGVIRSNLEPGRNGEPFTQTGLFQGCERGEDARYCAFHVDGWKYYAYADDPTPSPVLDAVAGLAVNTPVEIEGDLRFYGDITAEIAVRAVRPQPGSDPFAEIRAQVQGAWVSLEDPAAQLTITGSEIAESHGGAEMNALFFQIADTCDAAHGAGPVMIQIEPELREPQCYLIARADGQNLVLVYLARGTALRYGRP